MTRYISCTETAKLVRAALKEHFKGVKFSVRSSSYAGGASIDVRWVDGPCMAVVDAIVKRFQGATFDSSIDLKSYITGDLDGEEVHFGADYVMTHRNFSFSFVEAVAKRFCKEYGLPPLRISGSENDAWADTRHLSYYQDHDFREMLYATEGVYQKVHNKKKTTDAQKRATAERIRREQERKRQAEEAAERKRKERAEAYARQQREQQRRDRFAARKRSILSSKANALAYFGLSYPATRAEVMKAFREKVKERADGNGGYRGDMDLLVKAKELALR